MPRQISRRRALSAAAMGAGYFVASGARAQQPPRSPNERIRFACVGVGGKGSANTDDAARAGDVVALCDTDDLKLEGKAKAQPQAQKYFDFRKLLEECEKNIDAVVISTADHTHAVISLMAMRMGKHVYCEKPLCRYLFEARQLSEVARQQGVVTQMGNQGSANANFRKALDAIRMGAIGTIREVHVWSGRFRRPTGTVTPNTAQNSPPKTLHWNEWLGPAQATSYSPDYEAGRWQGWWPFGTGAIGDAASHVMNLAFHAADLRNPLAVEAQHTGHNKIAFPKSSHVQWQFAATARRPAVVLHWYDGDNRPPTELFHGQPIPVVGCLLVGSSGSLHSLDDMNSNWLRLPEKSPLPLGKDYLPPPVSHFAEFAGAISGNGATLSNFPHVAVPFTETLLLGNLALWADQKIAWDADSLTPKDLPDLVSAIKPEYRAGYVL